MEAARRWWRTLCLAVLAAGHAACGGAEPALQAGFGAADITPQVDGRRGVWLAGFAPGRRATAVHDPLFARAVVLHDGRRKVALACVDLLGLMRPEVEQIRAALPGYEYVLVSSTHTHGGPDPIGLWAPTPFLSGADPAYLDRVRRGVVAAIRQAEQRLAPAEAAFGTAEDASLLADHRLPRVLDPVLRVVRFTAPRTGATVGLLVVWNCHPEALGPKNTEVTADFVATTVAELETRHRCPVAYFSGAVGGLMSVPENRFRDAQGKLLTDTQFELAAAYGSAVADLADRAIAAAQPLPLVPLAVARDAIRLPLENRLYGIVHALGLVVRPAFEWAGDPWQRGPAWSGRAGARPAIESEVACLRLGGLSVAAIPGEIYPELLAGQVADPPDPAADFPDAAAEPAVWSLLPRGRHLLIGLANDEIGYLLPRRQWDVRPPFAYGRSTPQYGEINSLGPDTAGHVLEALGRQARRVTDTQP